MKDFSEFAQLVDSDFGEALDEIGEDTDSIEDPVEASVKINARITMLLLQKYHSWINS